MLNLRATRVAVGALALGALLIPAVNGSSSTTVARDSCKTPVFQNGLDLVFGRAGSQAAANQITQSAETAGFEGVKTVRDSCTVWESALRGLNSFDTAVAIQDEARRVSLYPTIECALAQEIGQLQAIFGTEPTVADLQQVIAKANSFGYTGLKTKTAPCGGYQAYVAGFTSRAEADDFAQVATERTGLQVTIVRV
jgi:hypothetical protein